MACVKVDKCSLSLKYLMGLPYSIRAEILTGKSSVYRDEDTGECSVVSEVNIKEPAQDIETNNFTVLCDSVDPNVSYLVWQTYEEGVVSVYHIVLPSGVEGTGIPATAYTCPDVEYKYLTKCFRDALDPSITYERVICWKVGDEANTSIVWFNDSGVVPEPANYEPCGGNSEIVHWVNEYVASGDTPITMAQLLSDASGLTLPSGAAISDVHCVTVGVKDKGMKSASGIIATNEEALLNDNGGSTLIQGTETQKICGGYDSNGNPSPLSGVDLLVRDGSIAKISVEFI